MDKKDLLILEKLQGDSSKTVKTIARELDLPRSTVHDRIKRMRDDGTIRKYTVVVDNKRLGKPVTLFLLVSYEPNKKFTQKEVAEKLARIEGISELHIIGGEWDMLLKVRGQSIDSLGEMIIDKIRAVDGVKSTLTITSFAAVKEELS